MTDLTKSVREQTPYLLQVESRTRLQTNLPVQHTTDAERTGAARGREGLAEQTGIQRTGEGEGATSSILGG